MNYLIVGSGGREHALAWKLGRESGVETVYVAPGNDGMEADPDVDIECVDIEVDASEELADFASEHSVDLTVVGPEGPLCAGIVDYFRRHDLPIFGPDEEAARLEGSKSYAKDVMTSAGVPTAGHEIFDELGPALEHVSEMEHPVAVKADGLAGGKGVVVSEEVETSRETLVDYMRHDRFGEASQRVVIERGLVGREMSFIAITDGAHVVPLATSQDHKPVGEGGTGPNTGGMGAVAPAPEVDTDFEQKILREIIHPTLGELRSRGVQYEGFLYAGLMWTDDGPKVLEFNCRMGDPEAQPLVFALDRELGPTLRDVAYGELSGERDLRSETCACCVVLASRGYPAPERDTSHRLRGLDEAASKPETKLFHAATRLEDGAFYNDGGRVLGVTGRGDTESRARERAYDAVSEVDWEGMHYRGDIGRADD